MHRNIVILLRTCWAEYQVSCHQIDLVLLYMQSIVSSVEELKKPREAWSVLLTRSERVLGVLGYLILVLGPAALSAVEVG